MSQISSWIFRWTSGKGLRTLAIDDPKIFEEVSFESTKVQGHIRGQVSEIFQLGLGHSVPLFLSTTRKIFPSCIDARSSTKSFRPLLYRPSILPKAARVSEQ